MKDRESFRMLPTTKKLLEQDLQRKKEDLANISKETSDVWEGDQWHSTTFREQQRRRELAIRHLQRFVEKEGHVELLQKPKQNEVIETGHMVNTKFLDDPEIRQAGADNTRVHLLKPEDVYYIGSRFNNIDEMAVSDSSPLGMSLLGKKRGDTASFGPGQRVMIKRGKKAISNSYLFDE